MAGESTTFDLHYVKARSVADARLQASRPRLFPRDDLHGRVTASIASATSTHCLMMASTAFFGVRAWW